MSTRFLATIAGMFLVAGCVQVQPTPSSSEIRLTPYPDGSSSLEAGQLSLLRDQDGAPISTHILEDTSLGTVHTFDIFPIVLSSPERSEEDELWRMLVWVSSGNAVTKGGYEVTLVLGYDDTIIEYETLPGYVFAWTAGNTARVADVVADLVPGEQLTVHIIGEHVFTPADIEAIGALGFDYPQLVQCHEEENMAILTALVQGRQPPPGEVRGVGLIYRGTE